MVKIRVSFRTDEELVRVKELLAPVMLSCRESGNREGEYRKAYIVAKSESAAATSCCVNGAGMV